MVHHVEFTLAACLAFQSAVEDPGITCRAVGLMAYDPRFMVQKVGKCRVHGGKPAVKPMLEPMVRPMVGKLTCQWTIHHL